MEYVAEPELEYPDNFHVRLVSSPGSIKMHDTSVFLSSALNHKLVGLQPIGPGRRYAVWFAQHRIGVINFADERPTLQPLNERAA